MILLLMLILAVGWGLLRGGQLSNLQFLTLHRLGAVAAGFVIQAAVIYLPITAIVGNAGRMALLALAYGLCAWFVWANRHLPGMWLLGIGLAANWLVILANGGYMPITYETLAAAGQVRLAVGSATGTPVFGSKDILLPLAETRLGFLSDQFVIPPPIPIPGIFSFGDVLIALGLFWLIPHALGVGRKTCAVALQESGNAHV